MLQELYDPLFEKRGVRLLIKRDDLIHPVISGNKWRKLKYNLTRAKELRHTTLLSFGGAHSNHIHALAAAGVASGFNTIGVIRGEARKTLNPTLQFAQENGMHLHYLDRETYRAKDSRHVLAYLRHRYGRFYSIPEGGRNTLAVKGCSEIITEIETATKGDFDAVFCACGTGATLAGLVMGLAGRKIALGVAVLKNADFLYDDVNALLRQSGVASLDNWRIELDYHQGGYAKLTQGLVRFMDEFEKRHYIPIEPIYTGKMLYGVYNYIERGCVPRGTTWVVVHTGGLQGKESMLTKMEKLRCYKFNVSPNHKTHP